MAENEILKNSPKNKISPQRQREIDSNPCFKEQQMSFDCLSKTNDQSKCYLYFENYKTCKAFWNDIRIERMRNGIEPHMPKEDERQKLLEERYKGKKTLS